MADWIIKNPGASEQDLASFIENNVLSLKKIDEMYAIFDTMLRSYNTDRLPAVLYESYAKIAELRFDFRTASRMYYRAYQKTLNANFLIKAGLHALETGDRNTAFDYLMQAEKSSLTADETVLLTTLKARSLIEDGQADIAYALLTTLPFSVPKEKLTSTFYYLLYQSAERNGNLSEANLAYQTLTADFPYSVEVYMLNSPRVHPLPLPSRLLALGTQILQDLNNSVNAVPFSAPIGSSAPSSSSSYGQPPAPPQQTAPPQTSRPPARPTVQERPAIGYQVAAFVSAENAQKSLQYYTSVWERMNIPTKPPIISQESVDNTVFYQIILPFENTDPDDFDTQNKILRTLKQARIEGFIVRK